MNEAYALVDRNDEPVGTITLNRLEELMNPERQQYLRTSCAFLRNSKGELYVPRRLMNAFIAPGGLDFAMAKHIKPDETYLEAALSGFKEELDFSLEADDLQLVGILGPMLQRHLPYFCAIYLCERDDLKPQYSHDKFSGEEWLTLDELTKRLEDGESAKSLLLPALQLLAIKESK
jgi:isopentenyldiphosphate isomerase